MPDLGRRRLLTALPAVGLVAAAGRAHAHGPVGRVDPPLAPPAVTLATTDGRRCTLASLLAGRTTAIQLMFSGCSAICPIQGALFAEAARAMRGGDGAHQQLLSLSIDALGDSPASLQRWQTRHLSQVPAHWRAAVPAVGDVDRLLDFLQARAAAPDRHTGQVYYFDARGRLLLRSTDFPPAAEIVAQLERIERAKT